MNNRKSIKSVFAVLILTCISAHPIIAATLTIREDTARFHSDTVRYPAANTFVIVSAGEKHNQACSGPYVDSCRQLPAAHFQLGSATLTSSERQTLLDDLRRCEITKTTPLHVTGYACQMGIEKANRVLSLHRAWVVAGILQAIGYTIEDQDIQGKGEEQPLTNDPEKFAMNRRVEISLR
jgi:outer membrane protein OmpA-like peptidoglycan-associated protein